MLMIVIKIQEDINIKIIISIRLIQLISSKVMIKVYKNKLKQYKKNQSESSNHISPKSKNFETQGKESNLFKHGMSMIKTVK